MVFLTLPKTYGRRIRFEAKGKSRQVNLGTPTGKLVSVISVRSVWLRWPEVRSVWLPWIRLSTVAKFVFLDVCFENGRQVANPSCKIIEGRSAFG